MIIIANHGERIDIPSGAFLENKIVSGNLRILDHWAHATWHLVMRISACCDEAACVDEIVAIECSHI